MAARLTDRDLKEIIKLVKKHGGFAATSEATGIPVSTIKSRYSLARTTFPDLAPKFDITKAKTLPWANSKLAEKHLVERRAQVKASIRAESLRKKQIRAEVNGDPVDATLKDENDRLKRINKELTKAVADSKAWEAKMNNLSSARLEPAKWVPTSFRTGKGLALTPILFTSDFQVGEVVRADELDGMNEYNQDIFVQRYQLMIDKTIELAEHNTGATEFPGIVYLRGGDAISGEIHEELAQTNDLSAVPALKLLQRQERAGIRRLKERFGKVRVISIPGNHGRTTMKPHSKGYTERSFETMLAWWLADSFADDKDVTFWTPKSGDALFDVMGWWFLLSHGDRTGSRGGTGFIGPSAPIARGHRKLYDNYAMTGRQVDCILTGHLHTSIKLERGYANGSLVGYNEYARSFRATPDAAKQWLLFVHTEHMVSHSFELQLSRRPKRTAIEAE